MVLLMLNLNNFLQFDLITTISAKRFSKIMKNKCNRLLSVFIHTILLTALTSISFTLHASNIKVVMYGDSISAGYGMTLEESWPYLLNETYVSQQQGIRLINESISGETTGGGVARLSNVLERQSLTNQDWLIIELGGNDGLRGFPIATIKNNLETMISNLQTQEINVALMQVRIPPNYGKRYTSMFEGIYQELSEKYQIPLLPFFMDTIAVNPNYMLNDGIHPNKSAQVIIRDIMAPIIIDLVR